MFQSKKTGKNCSGDMIDEIYSVSTVLVFPATEDPTQSFVI